MAEESSNSGNDRQWIKKPM